VLPLLGAAAHAPIFFYQLPRVAPRGELDGQLVRGLARELARHGDWRLRWIEDLDRGARGGSNMREATAAPAAAATGGDGAALFDRLAAVPLVHTPPETFIYPLMHHVDEHGIAAEALTRLATVPAAAHADAGRAVLRAAAWSMLLEDDEHAPYGWSHCLTMPQAVLGVRDVAPDPGVALAVAATYVVGFRSALARVPLRAAVPTDPGVPWRDALDGDRPTAAAACWHAPAADRPALIEALATRASTQHDAHLVKYTLACLDAAADDPTHTPLFLAAAASLGAWWAARNNEDDPLR
jgi:hypothetical protein